MDTGLKAGSFRVWLKVPVAAYAVVGATAVAALYVMSSGHQGPMAVNIDPHRGIQIHTENREKFDIPGPATTNPPLRPVLPAT